MTVTLTLALTFDPDPGQQEEACFLVFMVSGEKNASLQGWSIGGRMPSYVGGR